MFLSSSSSSKKKSRHTDDETVKRRARRIGSSVRSEDARVTFENILSSISSMPDDRVSKESVKAMVKSIYEWLAMDPNAQICLPTSRASETTPKMWPHGAVVDSRRGKSVVSADDNHKGLRDLDDETASTVATSVVSSSAAVERPLATGGVIVSDQRRDSLEQPVIRYLGSQHATPQYGQSQRTTQYSPMYTTGDQQMYPQQHHSHTGQMHNSVHTPLDTVTEHSAFSQPSQYNGAPSAHPPMTFRPSAHSGFGNAQQSNVRYSIMGAMPPPVEVTDTPEPPKARVRKVRARPRVGTAPRQAEDDDNGIPVEFAT